MKKKPEWVKKKVIFWKTGDFLCFEAGTKNPVKYCYLTGTKQKTNTMNKH